MSVRRPCERANMNSRDLIKKLAALGWCSCVFEKAGDSPSCAPFASMGSAMRVASSELPSALAALRSRRRRRRVKGPVRRSHGRRYA
jgi:hypothetical protein